jgi:diguanylate cyclase (GGDEF)-like protein
LSELARLFAQYGSQPLLDSTQNLIALVAADGRLLESNPAFEKLRAAQPAAALQDFVTADSRPVVIEMLQTGELRQACLGLKTWPLECGFKGLLIPLPDKMFIVWIEPAWEAHQAEVTLLRQQLAAVQKALELKKIDLESVLVQADEVSHTDALTFLPNRRQIIRDLQREVLDCKNRPEPLTIFMLDLDHFKQVNDTYGHPAGDQILRRLAGELQAAIRPTDQLGRYGGEEFLVLLPSTHSQSAIKMADRFLELTRNLRVQVEAGRVAQVTISIGIAQHKIGQETWDELLNRADQALYQSKREGRNRWSLSQFEDHKAGTEKLP